MIFYNINERLKFKDFRTNKIGGRKLKKVLRAVKHYIKVTDKLLIFLCLTASCFGLALIYSASHQGGMHQTIVQAGAILLGLTAAIIISNINYESLSALWPVIAAVAVGLMILTVFFGVGPAGSDNKAWLTLPGGLSIQPSEILKIAFIITFSRHLTLVKDELNRFSNVVLLCLHAAVPIGLVLLTKDDGSATVFIAIFVFMMISAGLWLRYIILGGALAGIAAPLIWFFYFDSYQRERFLVVFDPDKYDPGWQKLFYQQGQGQIAIGAGGLTGSGYLSGVRTQGEFVPKNYNDFVLTVAGEELGFVGVCLIFALLLAIFFRILYVGHRSNFTMGKLICVGVFAMLAFQAIINIGMCLCVLPVIGITLPFFSAGGSSVVALYLSIGLVLSVRTHNEKRTAYDRLR